MLIKQKSPLLPTNLALMTSGKLLIMFSRKVNLMYLLYSVAWRCCLLHLIKQNFSMNSNIDDSGFSLPVFPSITNLKLHNIYVTPQMVRKVVMNLYLSKASGPDCTVKPVLTTIFLKRPPVLNDHVVVLAQVFRSNISIQ